MLGAGRVIAIDRVPERLALAQEGETETINFKDEDVYERLIEMTNGRGPDRCIDAVGCEAHGTGELRFRPGQGEGGRVAGDLSRARHSPGDHVLPQAGHDLCAGCLRGHDRQVSVRRGDEQRADDQDGATHVQRYLQPLLEKIEAGEIDPSFVITHRRPLQEGPELYKTFRAKEDGYIKVVLTP